MHVVKAKMVVHCDTDPPLSRHLSANTCPDLQADTQDSPQLQEVAELGNMLGLPSVAQVVQELSLMSNTPELMQKWRAFPGTSATAVSQEECAQQQALLQRAPHLLQLPEQFQVKHQ